MIGVEEIADIKNDSKKLFDLIKTNNNKDILTFLKKMGRLSPDFDEKPLVCLLSHKNDNIRYLAVKNLAKLVNIELLDIYVKIINSDPSSIVRREAASAPDICRTAALCRRLRGFPPREQARRRPFRRESTR